ncbi:ArdC-like ssDNA-binding domain-containing protein [Dietzia cinnamea]|uniref:ArdC-like ssDNA-binding domain-containing protein n=1 Tax=Dietzia cinnamea TaxID=321318 RepID=UPI0021A37270|nr:ArdC-like ssDNA-binding domain-containing protein [Dietzia cinnamea]MCT1884447.1 ArdC-like ssDNA-binding domain-containing protein [Dietzia cinnamea]
MARKTYTPQQKEAARAARAEKVEQMHDELSAAVDALMQSGRWLRWLDFLGSFHRYSFNNTMLIQVQCPHATQVAGFKAWQAKGRQVRKGEKGIRIFGKPFRLVSETDEATGETTRKAIKCPPPVVSVFDISQTDPIEGVEQLTAPVAQLQGDDHAALYERISEWMTGQGWTVTREQIPGESNGYCTVDGTRRIVVDADLSDAHAAKTAIHEAAHAILHTDDTPRTQASHVRHTRTMRRYTRTMHA